MKSKLILGAILALLLAVTSVSFAFASGDAKGDNNGDKVRILQVTLQHRGQEAQLDLGAPGPSIGDRFIFFDDVFQDGEKVGTRGVECVVVRFNPPDETDQCVTTMSLSRGQISTQGLITVTAPGPRTLAITGGTGTFRTAHGEVKVTQESETVEQLTLKLILSED